MTILLPAGSLKKLRVHLRKRQSWGFTPPEDPQQLRGTPGTIRSHPRLVTTSRYWYLAESSFLLCFVLKLFLKPFSTVRKLLFSETAIPALPSSQQRGRAGFAPTLEAREAQAGTPQVRAAVFPVNYFWTHFCFINIEHKTGKD